MCKNETFLPTSVLSVRYTCQVWREREGKVGSIGKVKNVNFKIIQSWALPVFFNFFNNKKLFFAFFIKLIRLGVGFLYRTVAEIGY